MTNVYREQNPPGAMEKLLHDNFWFFERLIQLPHCYTGWWFGPFFIFPYIGNNNSNWRTHIFQRDGEKPPTSIIGIITTIII